MQPGGAEAREPIRTCIGCRQPRPQSALVRLTRSARGIVADGASDGRGAWLCRVTAPDGFAEPACLDTAIKKGAFARAWRGPVTAAERQLIRACLTRQAPGH